MFPVLFRQNSTCPQYYTEQRQLHAELNDYADALVISSLRSSSASRRSAPPAH
ncbi:hypothetical protein B381_00645 [Stutzerimonas stutzeri NF13]|uniref:Uncharacterized protein n=1 Tax=Stutzerimonas stutzeri NF13 TaxID=1212548 RepID=M2VQ85_STUST|nr:hypothetical protein B381_00645 [Stutzerimonas stutzeri NF13]